MKQQPRPFFLGFTLIELLVTLAIIAIISAVIVPNFLGSQLKAKDDNAISRGAILDLAKASFQQKVPNAKEQWTNWDASNEYAATPPMALSVRDEGKYNLLRPYLSSPPGGSGAGGYYGLGWGLSQDPGGNKTNQYSPYNYYYKLGDINGPTRVFRRDIGEIGPSGSQTNVTLNIAVNPAGAGSAEPSGTYAAGSVVDISAHPNGGYLFSNWTTSGGSISNASLASTKITLPNVATNVDLTARFNPDPNYGKLTLKINQTTGGTVTASPGGTNPPTGYYTNNTHIFVNANNNLLSGYAFTGWDVKPAGVTNTGPTFTFYITNNCTLQARYSKGTYAINASPNNASWGSVTGSGNYPQGETANLTATPSQGYQFVNWTEGGSQVSTSSTYSFTVNSSRTLTANFQAEGNYLAYAWTDYAVILGSYEEGSSTVTTTLQTVGNKAWAVGPKNSTVSITSTATQEKSILTGIRFLGYDSSWNLQEDRYLNINPLQYSQYGLTKGSTSISMTHYHNMFLPMFTKSTLGDGPGPSNGGDGIPLSGLATGGIIRAVSTDRSTVYIESASSNLATINLYDTAQGLIKRSVAPVSTEYIYSSFGGLQISKGYDSMFGINAFTSDATHCFNEYDITTGAWKRAYQMPKNSSDLCRGQYPLSLVLNQAKDKVLHWTTSWNAYNGYYRFFNLYNESFIADAHSSFIYGVEYLPIIGTQRYNHASFDNVDSKLLYISQDEVQTSDLPTSIYEYNVTSGASQPMLTSFTASDAYRSLYRNLMDGLGSSATQYYSPIVHVGGFHLAYVGGSGRLYAQTSRLLSNNYGTGDFSNGTKALEVYSYPDMNLLARFFDRPVFQNVTTDLNTGMTENLATSMLTDPSGNYLYMLTSEGRLYIYNDTTLTKDLYMLKVIVWPCWWDTSFLAYKRYFGKLPNFNEYGPALGGEGLIGHVTSNVGLGPVAQGAQVTLTATQYIANGSTAFYGWWEYVSGGWNLLSSSLTYTFTMSADKTIYALYY
ncbi:MAG: InlB B-repeat-containing protein [Verrucomicrobiota bacterium]